MASRYNILRRTIHAAREGWSQQVNALPEVANEVGPDFTTLPGLSSANAAPSSNSASLRQALANGTGRSLVCPRSSSRSASACQDALGLAWPPAVPPPQSATAIAASTLPAVASLLKTPRTQAAAAPGTARNAAQSAGGETAAALAAAGSQVPVAPPANHAAAAGQLTQGQGHHTVQPPPPPPGQPRRTAPRMGSSSSNSVSLNKQIMACRSTEELLSLVQQRGSGFDFFNISSAIARVPKLATAAPAGAPQHPGAPPLNAPSDGTSLHLDAAGRNLLDCLARLMCNNIHTFDARGLANAAWAFGKLKYTPSNQLASVIASAALPRLQEFSPQNLANMMWAFVYLHHRDPALLAAVAQQVVARVRDFKPQELANITWAFASLDFRDDAMLAAVAGQAECIAHLFKEQELSNVLWAYGKLHAHHPRLVEALMAETRAKLHAFLPQGISNVAWALASLGYNDVPFLDQVMGQCGHRLSSFDAQALSNLAWAMASLGYYRPAFLSALVQECMVRGLERLSPQNLSNILWSCATLGHQDPRMLSAWATLTLEKLGAFEPQGLSNSAWAFARLGYHNPLLFDALGAAALLKLDHFTAQGLSNLAWAFATTGVARPQLFEALSQRATAAAAAFNAQNCSMMLWSCATLRHYDAALFSALVGRLAEEDWGACEPQNVANALWALARMGHAPGAAAQPLARAALSLLPRMNQQELCNTFWSMAVLEMLDVESFNLFSASLAGGMKAMTPEGMHQVYHAQLMFHSWLSRCAGVPLSQLPQDALPRLPEPLEAAAASMWQASVREAAQHVSRFHNEVSSALNMAGMPHALEWPTSDDNLSVDIGMQVNAQDVAVEVDGAHRYTSNEPFRPLSGQAVRKRLLEDRGWSVVNVGFPDWESMGGSLGDRATGLLGRIADAVGTWDWRSVGPPRRPGGIDAAAAGTADARDAQAAAEAAARGLGVGGMEPGNVAAWQQALAAFGLGPGAVLPLLEAYLPSLAMSGAAGDAAARAFASPTSQVSPASATPPYSPGHSSSSGAVAVAQHQHQHQNQLLNMERAGSMFNEEQVAQALSAAEALQALPDGDALLAAHTLSVLGVQLPGSGALHPSELMLLHQQHAQRLYGGQHQTAASAGLLLPDSLGIGDVAGADDAADEAAAMNAEQVVALCAQLSGGAPSWACCCGCTAPGGAGSPCSALVLPR